MFTLLNRKALEAANLDAENYRNLIDYQAKQVEELQQKLALLQAHAAATEEQMDLEVIPMSSW